jgi:Fe-S-cluster-containing dehydrogenase component
MGKALIIDHERCTGCRICELACSMHDVVDGQPRRPRITAVTWELEGWGVPVPCQHCEEPPCMAVCPKEAVFREEVLDRVSVDYDRCIGCRMCVVACPFGAMGFDEQHKRVIKCDYCDGDPECVKLCSYGALHYLEINEQTASKSTDVAEKFRQIRTGSQNLEPSDPPVEQ